jgi:iron(III) transport system ATP-binding protein
VRISVRGLRKTFRPERGQDVTAVDRISIDVEDGEFLVILGPSGSGKTTLLRCIAGLERADEGEIEVDGQLVYSSTKRVWVPPERRRISMVFQSYALWPHMNVFENVAYPLRTKGVAAGKVRDRVQAALDLVGCGSLGRRHPGQLSGGQQQRVAVARAIVDDSRVVLFDEPLSSVDARVRDELRRELVALQRELGFSSVYITHDQTEAIVLAHRVAILANGNILQVATPRDLYTKPNSEYVAEFMGAANRFDGKVEATDDRGTVVRGPFGGVVASGDQEVFRIGDRVTVIFRPEYARLAITQQPENINSWPCHVERALFMGFCTEYVLKVQDGIILLRTMERQVFAEGTSGWITVDPDDVRLVSSE